MINPIQVTWNKDYQNDGLHYFFQRIVEMLDFKTLDIFRSPLLNTHCLINEYIDITTDSVKTYHLNEVYNEFIESFKNDVVVRSKWSQARIDQVVDKLNKEPSKRKSIMEYLNSIIGTQYFNWTKAFLLVIVPQGREKRKIDRGIRCLIPELLQSGYSRDEIYHSAKYMLSNDIDPNQALKDFLGKYDRLHKKYTVYIALSDKLQVLEDIIKTRFNANYEDDGNFNKVEAYDTYHVIKTDNIRALDASTAANTVFQRIELFTSLYQYIGNYSGRYIHNRALVISENGNELLVNIARRKYYSIKDDNPPEIGRRAAMILSSLNIGAKFALPQLQKTIALHNRAISNNGLENGFLALWSLLEVICEINPNASHFEQVRKIVVPILKRDYFPTVFYDITENLTQLLDRELYKTMVSEIKTDEIDYIKIAKLILLPENSTALNSLIDALYHYPVLRTRIHNLHNDCHRKNDLYNMAERYAQRITWHLFRLYRTRNAITHSGKTPMNLKDLGEHLHLYVDNIINEIVTKLSAGKLCRISNVLIDSEFQQEKWDEYFIATEPINSDTIKWLFSSQNVVWDS